MDTMSDESERIQVDFHLHVHGLAEALGPLFGIARQILLEIQEIKVSQTTNQQAIDTANAALQASLDSIQTDVTAITTELAAAVPVAGSVPTQAQIDTLNANVARLQSVKAALDGLVVPAPAPGP